MASFVFPTTLNSSPSSSPYENCIDLTDFLNLSPVEDHMGSVQHKGLISTDTHDSTYDINSIYTYTLTTNKNALISPYNNIQESQLLTCDMWDISLQKSG